MALKVTTPHPELSQQLASRIVDELDSLNLRTQQGRATPERQFIEQRMAIAEGELHQAENRLAAFLESNRQFATPQLQLDRDRLNRDVAMRQQLYTALVEAYQRARIDEVRNMPAITVLEPAEQPYAPDSRRVVSTIVIGLAFGTVLGLFVAFARDSWKHLRLVVERDESQRAAADDASAAQIPTRTERSAQAVRAYKP
ncbi:MAG TPA: GNVR domain-containing protein [Candidatus Elarobacter sp.]|nr:GNVR domain-containing protein [Candidatus Elarobacter sp.]